MRDNKTHRVACVVLSLSAIFIGGQPAVAQQPAGATRALTELSLEELMNIEVTSVSKREEKLSETAAAIYVVTTEDIRRSGATTVAEALRMVPGMHVAHINSNLWAIASRGFNDEFTSKLLVLVDGRSVYTPLNAGVHWEVQQMVLEDIDRIEVIRGPGASLWGANAVNGVINIITKHAKQTQGWLATGGWGSEEQGFGSIRYGGHFNPTGFYRMDVQYANHDSFVDAAGNGTDDAWHFLRGGGRADWAVGDADTLTFLGNLYDGRVGLNDTTVSLTAPLSRVLIMDRKLTGGHVLGRWGHRFSDRSEMSAQVSYDRYDREDLVFRELHHIVDFDLQHSLALNDFQRITWGMGYRLSADDTNGSVPGSGVPDVG